MTGGVPGGGEIAVAEGDVARLGMRTSLMTLDLLLAVLPPDGSGYADAAAEACILSRRIGTATADFAEMMRMAR
ncbi:hypothetical protein [Niveispirillum fermenti]|uniref:hypothetical protein n=1 Tax=Niveispirillum fermenti TaxID=1233113 RepID=UPI003A8C2C5A